MAKKANNPVKKTAAKKPPPKDKEREALLKELLELIPGLDAEGLALLADQAKVHIYNMQVDEHNRAIVAEAEKTGSVRKSGGKAASGTAKPAFAITGGGAANSGASYYLHYGNNDVMFSGNEMIRMVKIVNGPGTDLEIRERLYNWFENERKDIFALVNFRDKFDERLKSLVTEIKKSFRLKKS